MRIARLSSSTRRGFLATSAVDLSAGLFVFAASSCAQFTDGKAEGEAVHNTCFSCHERAKDRDGNYEATPPKQHWSDWYAAHIVTRERGRTAEDAVKDAALRMVGVRR